MKYGSVTMGQVEALLNKIGGVEGMNNILRGTATVQITKHIIDLSGDPMPEDWKKAGWQTTKHTYGVTLELDPSQLKLHLSENQKNGRVVEVNSLKKELEDNKVPVLNACILDYLLAHPELIPESWKKDENGNTRYIYFWGTEYRHPDGDLYVRYLCWRDGAWLWSDGWLGNAWDAQFPAAILASLPVGRQGALQP